MDVSGADLRQTLPRWMAAGACRVTGEMDSGLADLDARDRDLCRIIALATWVFELDKAGDLFMPPRDVAYVYQAGRIAAQELAPASHSRLKLVIDALRWPRGAGQYSGSEVYLDRELISSARNS